MEGKGFGADVVGLWSTDRRGSLSLEGLMGELGVSDFVALVLFFSPELSLDFAVGGGWGV
jgi:hypothetical protein